MNYKLLNEMHAAGVTRAYLSLDGMLSLLEEAGTLTHTDVAGTQGTPEPGQFATVYGIKLFLDRGQMLPNRKQQA